jgi:hypothetical protein
MFAATLGNLRWWHSAEITALEQLTIRLGKNKVNEGHEGFTVVMASASKGLESGQAPACFRKHEP